MSSTSPLLAPLTLRNGVVAPNRVWLAPMTNLQSHEDGSLSDDELRWLERRADGGFGVIETCAAYVATDGKAWPGELGVHDDAMTPGLERLAASLSARGALGIAQLFHGGVRASEELTGAPLWSASAVAQPNVPTPRAATEEDLHRVVAQFAAAAARCARAGLAGVELHGAHGYLFGQFLSSVQNVRDDAWGGPLERRAKLLLDAVHAVRAATSPGFVIGVRISPEDFGQSVGLDLDESLTVAGWLADAGVDFLHVSLWDVHRMTTKRPDEHAIPLFRAAVPREVPLIVAGKVWTRADGEEALARGADAVALGRSAILNPEWPGRVAGEGEEPLRPPVTHDDLLGLSLNDTFATYMRAWRGFVVDPE
ncbi:MAG: NADH:flavin oxidoreductase [Sandaracinaceae bacterium]|nr:NADH:flavin oxidoreductase [Sandaracinaceae bacterium]